VYEAIRLIGQVMGQNDEAEAIIADMQATFEGIAASVEQTDKTIYFEVMPLEWGLWTAGDNTFMHELAHICGMENAFADITDWQAISQEQVIERDPDYIVLVTGMGETAVDEVLGRENFDRCAALGGWLLEVKGRHSGIEKLNENLFCGIEEILKKKR
jgi:iron complex transport system substrate-binding protein